MDLPQMMYDLSKFIWEIAFLIVVVVMFYKMKKAKDKEKDNKEK